MINKLIILVYGLLYNEVGILFKDKDLSIVLDLRRLEYIRGLFNDTITD